MRGLTDLLLALASLAASPEPQLTKNLDQIFPDATYPDAVDPAATAGAQTLQSSPPFYPSPWMTGTGDWADAYAKAKDFVSQMTLMEKINITTGVGWEGEQCVGQTGSVPRLGLRSMCMQDSPVGVRG